MDSYCFMKRLQLWWMDQYGKNPFDTKFCTIIKKTSKILTYKSLLSIVQRNIRIKNHSSHSYLWVLIYHAPSVFRLMQSLETTDKLLFI